MAQNTKLLLIEDSVGDVGLLSAALREASTERAAFDIDHVLRLTDAFQKLKSEPYDLILLDLSLPDVEGADAVARMRESFAAAPIIVLASVDDEELAINSLRLGAQDYIIKGQVDSYTLARAIRYAIGRKRVELELEQQLTRQAALHELNLAITSTLDLKTVLDNFLDKVQHLLPEFALTVRLFNSETGALEPLACRGVDETSWKRPLRADQAAGRVNATLQRREPLVMEDALTDPRTNNAQFIRENGLVSHVGVPLFVKGEPIGVISFYTRQRREFAAAEVRFLATLASQAAVAIHNSQLYERLKKSNETLEKALEIKGVLVGVMAHELKTPLQVIMGASNLLSSGICGVLTEDQGLRVAAIERGADELLHLIDSTVMMTRPDHGKSQLVISDVCVHSLLAEIKEEFAAEFAKQGIELDVGLPPTTFTMRSDRIKLKEILRNLVENARKFTSQGKVVVQFARDDACRRVEFTVSDTGIGIDKNHLAKIFDLFYQVNPRPEPASTGLGLTIVKRLVTAMSGEIHVDSVVGQGTTFRFFLPLED